MNECNHDWWRVGEDTAGDVFWCEKCGALADEEFSEIRVTTNSTLKAMKPLWKDAPPWAKWLAQDESGVWHWFEYRPRNTLYVHRWQVPDSTARNGNLGSSRRASPSSIDWKKSLEYKPKE